MHYKRKAFSSNRQETITPISPNENAEIGQRNGMSPTDIAELRAIYK